MHCPQWSARMIHQINIQCNGHDYSMEDSRVRSDHDNFCDLMQANWQSCNLPVGDRGWEPRCRRYPCCHCCSHKTHRSAWTVWMKLLQYYYSAPRFSLRLPLDHDHSWPPALASCSSLQSQPSLPATLRLLLAVIPKVARYIKLLQNHTRSFGLQLVTISRYSSHLQTREFVNFNESIFMQLPNHQLLDQLAKATQTHTYPGRFLRLHVPH